MRGFNWLSWVMVLALLPFQMAGSASSSAPSPSSVVASAGKRMANLDRQPAPPLAGPPYDIFLPLVARNDAQPMLLGAYPYDWAGLETTYTGEMTPFDTWTGKKHSILGTFIDIAHSAPSSEVTGQLATIWSHGYTPFVNLMVCSFGGPPDPAGCSTGPPTVVADLASGSLNSVIDAWAIAYKAYAEGGGGRAAFIAPMPEMNGNWKKYSGDPANFILAYQQIRQRFQTNGVPASSVRWVFAPNGYTPEGDPTIEEYYPGTSVVDVVSFSSYNFGFMNYCLKGDTNPDHNRWDPPSFVFGHYLPQLRTMAPDKPILVSQTGTTAQYDASCDNTSAKNQWLIDAFNYLAGQQQVRGFIYYNTPRWEMIDWPVYGAHALILPPSGYTGYQTGAANPAYQYIAPAVLKNMPLLP